MRGGNAKAARVEGMGKQCEGREWESSLRGRNGKAACQGITGAIKHAETAKFYFKHLDSV